MYKCDECGKEKEDVRYRECVYVLELYGDEPDYEPRFETVCDECEHEHFLAT